MPATLKALLDAMAPQMQDITHYERLGVSRSADADDLRQAFRRLSKAVHPDTTCLPAQDAARQFRLLREAYEHLADPRRRRLYDAALRERETPKDTVMPSLPVPEAIGQRRPLSGGEWLSLLLLLGALLLCLLLGVGVAWSRGLELQVQPSWLVEEQTRSNGVQPGSTDGIAPFSGQTTQPAFSEGA